MVKKIIGVSKIALGRKISLIKEIADKLKVSIGDNIVYFEEDGKITIESA